MTKPKNTRKRNSATQAALNPQVPPMNDAFHFKKSLLMVADRFLIGAAFVLFVVICYLIGDMVEGYVNMLFLGGK